MADEKDLGLIYTGRGFKRFPEIESVYGGTIETYESSAAEEPRIWVRTVCPTNLNEPHGPSVEAVAHLNIADALRLAQQIQYLVEHHYQVEPPALSHTPKDA